jgi:circadian clock protein KaiC
MNSKDPHQLTRVPSGIKGLDDILRGGFFGGGLYIIEGPPGVGKTILGNQICFNQASARSKVLYVTLIAETVGRMLLNIKSLTFFNESEIGDGIVYFSGFNALKEKGLNGLLHLLRKEVASRKATTLIVDGFASASDHAQSHEELKLFVQQLQTQADAADCTVYLLTNPSEHTPSSEETMVDGIINLKTTIHEWRSARELCVRKFRGSSYLQGVHSYDISENGLTVYPRLETLVSPNTDVNGELQRVSSGNSRLDEMLGGGFPALSATMLIGPSGTGKTTIGLQFLSLSTANEPGLLLGFLRNASSYSPEGESDLSLDDRTARRGPCANTMAGTDRSISRRTCRPDASRYQTQKGKASADRRSRRFQESSSRETDRAFLFRAGP